MEKWGGKGASSEKSNRLIGYEDFGILKKKKAKLSVKR